MAIFSAVFLKTGSTGIAGCMTVLFDKEVVLKVGRSGFLNDIFLVWIKQAGWKLICRESGGFFAPERDFFQIDAFVNQTVFRNVDQGKGGFTLPAKSTLCRYRFMGWILSFSVPNP